MNLTSEQLKVMLMYAFDCGQCGSFELKKQYVEEILEKFSIESVSTARIFKIAELLAMPIGTTFFHTLLGKGCIAVDEKKKKYMKFEKSQRVAHFNSDSFPWTESMQIIPMINE
jgi:hypothetical protein